MAKLDLFIISIFIFILCSSTILIVIFFFNQEDKCMASPLTFSAKAYLDGTDANVVIGRLTLIKDSYTTPLVLVFDNNKIQIETQGFPMEPLNLTKIIK